MANPLFKFSTAEGALAILQHNSIFVTSPLDLNDPFEMRPAWTNEHDQRYKREKHGLAMATTGAPILSAMEGGKLALGGIMGFHPPQSHVDVSLHRGIADGYNEQLFQHLHRQYRVLSLTNNLFDLAARGGESQEQQTLLWSHYGAQFQGICLALESAHFYNGLKAGGFEVKYPLKRQSLPPSVYDINPPTPSAFRGLIHDPDGMFWVAASEYAERIDQALISFLTHKSPGWSYEKEVRMLYNVEHLRTTPHYVRTTTPCQACKDRKSPAADCENLTYRDAVKLPPQAVLAVIVGTDCLPSDVERLLAILRQPEYSGVELYWSALHSDEYKVQYVWDDDRTSTPILQRSLADRIARAKGHVYWKDGRGIVKHTPKNVNFVDAMPDYEADSQKGTQ